MSTLIDNIWFSLTAELAKEFAQRKLEPETLSYRELRHEVSEKRDFERRFKPRKTQDVDMGIVSVAQADSLARDTQAAPVSASEPRYYPLSPTQPGSEGYDLDALGKGKGKGLQCWSCLG